VNVRLCACAEAAFAVFGEMGCVELRPDACFSALRRDALAAMTHGCDDVPMAARQTEKPKSEFGDSL
jgi:hypothetical protein